MCFPLKIGIVVILRGRHFYLFMFCNSAMYTKWNKPISAVACETNHSLATIFKGPSIWPFDHMQFKVHLHEFGMK